jgi:hypothetical protein
VPLRVRTACNEGTGFVCAVSLVVLLAAASAGGAVPQSSVVGSGSGHFIETDGPFELTVNARGEGPLAQGRVRGSGDYVAAFQVEGPVTCMLVVGNRASIKCIEDNGKPVNGAPVDRVATEPPQPPEPSTPPRAYAPTRP